MGHVPFFACDRVETVLKLVYNESVTGKDISGWACNGFSAIPRAIFGVLALFE